MSLNRYTPPREFLVFTLFVFIAMSCSKPPMQKEVWFCPMHTDYRTDHAGKCPICGMDLVKEKAPTSAKETHADEHHSHAEHGTEDQIKSQESQTLHIEDNEQKLIGLKTSRPQKRKLSMMLKLSGEVAYEPDMYAAIIEYRQLAQAAKSLEGTVGSGAGLTQSAVLRLQQLGLGRDEIGQYANSEKAASRLITGYGAGKTLVTLRLSEADLAYVKKGLRVTVTAVAYPGKSWSGTITGVGKLVDAKNRSLSARALVQGPGGLTPQMALGAEIKIQAGQGVSIERSAVFDTGEKQVVFIKTTPTEFVPRVVRVVGGNDEYALVTGVTDKEEVVTSSTFLLDSEAKLRFGGATAHSEGHAH